MGEFGVHHGACDAPVAADAVQKMFGEVANGVGKAVIGGVGAIGDTGKAALGGVQDSGSAVKDAGKGAADKIKSLF